MDDHELLRRFEQSRSQDAFQELVDRHLAMVLSSARRMVQDAHLAEEVAQGVFTTLAQKAGSLSPPQVVGGWLYNTTRHLAMHAVRTEQRRREREQMAVTMQSLEANPDADRITEQLEPAMAELESDERDALVLRYLENRSLREVGAEFGISEDAARMRVNRALDRLRTVFARQGISATSVFLGTVLVSSTASSAVPVGLAAALTTAALAGTTFTATIATQTAATTMNWLNIKSITAIFVAAVAAGTGTHLVQQREATRWLNENQNLIAERGKLTNERDTSLSAIAANKAELERLQKNQSELLRLRGEVGLLRKQAKELERLREENRRLQAGLAKVAQSSEQAEAEAEADPQRKTAIAKMELAKELLLGLRMYAADNGDRYPTEFAQVLSVFKKDSADLELRPQVSSILKNPDPYSTMLNQFEIVIHGSETSVTNADATIAIREKEAWLLNGKRVKVYGYADGHSEVHAEPPEGFEVWEKQRMVPPQASR